MAGLNQVKLKQEAAKSEAAKPEGADLAELAGLSPEEKQKNIKKRNKLLRQIEELQARKEKGEKLDSDQTKKLNRKEQVLKELEVLNAWDCLFLKVTAEIFLPKSGFFIQNFNSNLPVLRFKFKSFWFCTAQIPTEFKIWVRFLNKSFLPSHCEPL